MAKELYFIKTNPVIAKINLYNKLCREENNVLSFLNDDKKTSLEIIKNKVKDSVEELSPEELLQIFNWFKNEYRLDKEEMKTQLFINGIDLFYEIPSEAHVNNFQKILSDYEKHSQSRLNFISDCENFNHFLIYGIFYTQMIKKENEDILPHFLKSDYKKLYILAENQFNLNGVDKVDSDNLYNYFIDLYDFTKHYKGSIIKLYAQ
ncbi:hypothetical protein SAMN05421664_2438 [Chryseobacterium soldanellicola]|uniref:Uncharacterized protein n=1 Tax=Chryseobacterium soldanellicola TaxID=311333 RepID=A0A1H1DE91_9FLAO|nr:hypothetical protein [Chryseobacterium soldanellicola]SDQ74813.1 hypothetical protein SAMN05421664_2438 [Chryseobacterium soldanellicola]